MLRPLGAPDSPLAAEAITIAAALVALVGVAATPVLVLADAPTEKLTPPDDFRGSATYRTELATVLARRVVEALR